MAVQRYLEKRGVAEVLVQALPDYRTSPNQIPVLDIAWTFLATVLTGGIALRAPGTHPAGAADAVVRTILGVTRMPSAMTLTRYFERLGAQPDRNICPRRCSGNLCYAGCTRRALGAVLDLDSTVVSSVTGISKAVSRVTNPRKHGRLSRPGESHPEALTDSGRELPDSSGSCHRMKTAAFRH